MSGRLTKKALKQTLRENKSGGSSDIWSPMGNLEQGETASVRLIPFEDELTKSFWVIQKTIYMKFVNPDDDSKFWTYSAPCLEMYESPADVRCPLANHARKLFKDADALKKSGETQEHERILNVALAHWIKPTYWYQGFVVKGGKDTHGPNDLVPIKFPKSVFKVVEAAVEEDEDAGGLPMLPSGEFNMDDAELYLNGEVADDMDADKFEQLFVGRNLVARKVEKGGFNNYEQSSWAPTDTMITDEQLAALVDKGYIDLRKLLPNRPSDEEYDVLEDMVQVSIEYALGEGDGLWNPVWESEYGFKPNKGREESSSSSGDSNAASRLKKRNESKGSAAGSLKAKRGVTKKAEVADDEPTTSEDTNADAGSDEAEEKPVADKMSLKERLAAKKKAAAEANA